MYRHILVPLDGSHLAEQILTHVQHIASPGDARITLLRAVPPLHTVAVEFGGGYSGSTALTDDIALNEQAARDYLNGIVTVLRAEGFNISAEISRLPAAEAILDYAHHHHVDLIAIATHGRSGVSRWVFGSVTQKVIQAAPVPVLVARPHELEEEKSAAHTWLQAIY